MFAESLDKFFLGNIFMRMTISYKVSDLIQTDLN